MPVFEDLDHQGRIVAAMNAVAAIAKAVREDTGYATLRGHLDPLLNEGETVRIRVTFDGDVRRVWHALNRIENVREVKISDNGRDVLARVRVVLQGEG